MIVSLIDEAVGSGARQHMACKELGVSFRSIQRWRKRPEQEDQRRGPSQAPANKLSRVEREQVLETINSPGYRDLSPKQIVPKLADEGQYLASESTMYRLLEQQDQLTHRERSRPRQSHRPKAHVATGPNQVWSWDITYLRGPVLGTFFFLYMILDVWSRKIVGWQVHEHENADFASELFCDSCTELNVDAQGLVLHSDNGGPQKGATMLATLQRLGVIASFSRPHVSDDNPYSEALFRTVKYRPEYPSKPFASLEEARAWVAAFAHWYNTQHLHSSIRFVTPDDRHFGREGRILRKRRWVYEQARRLNPNRWSGQTRNWDPVEEVFLNPEPRGRNNTVSSKAA
jgi:transposase InsO family protein